MAKKSKKELREIAGKAVEALRDIQRSETPTYDHDANGKATRGRPCQTCCGTGEQYCCESWTYTMACLEEVQLEWSHALPKFPNSGMEMSYCPFCGTELRNLCEWRKPNADSDSWQPTVPRSRVRKALRERASGWVDRDKRGSVRG